MVYTSVWNWKCIEDLDIYVLEQIKSSPDSSTSKIIWGGMRGMCFGLNVSTMEKKIDKRFTVSTIYQKALSRHIKNNLLFFNGIAEKELK